VKKKAKAEATVEVSEREDLPAQVPVKETEEVKEVTQGVKDVELQDGKPESVPLPVTPPPEPRVEQEAELEEVEEVTEKAEGNIGEKAEGKDEEQIPISLEGAAPLLSVSPGKPAKQPVATGTPEAALPAKKPRKTHNLPTKTAKSTSKSVKKVVESFEQKGKISGDVLEKRKDGTTV